MKKIIVALVLCLVLAASCSPATPQFITPTSNSFVPTAPMPTVTKGAVVMWIDPRTPVNLKEVIEASGILQTESRNSATMQLALSPSQGIEWIYALAAPFPTVTDDVSFSDLQTLWQTAAGPLSGRSLLMAESPYSIFTELWGSPAQSVVQVAPEGALLDLAWARSAWVILPFEEIQPMWKILAVDGQSPLRKDFDPSQYSLKAYFELSGGILPDLPSSNRDADRLATVVLTGVTALVRATAATMEIKGITYPGTMIKDWMTEADVAHISNEVPFDSACPPPNFSYTNLILCSDPRYMELLLDVGTDIVELTGDHFADRGTQAMLDTLNIYTGNGIPYYGGGANAEDASRAVLMEVNGNRLAFMGCNGKQKYAKATATSPGAADCDYELFEEKIRTLIEQGYQVIFTFQHEECYVSTPCYTHEAGFRRIADAGAVVVSGSQAHYPQIMEFRRDSFIHYGLGNLFFDQMTYIMPDGSVIDETRREFLDRHVFYNGRYLGAELLTAILEDFSLPRPMNAEERSAFLTEYFYYSGWTQLPITPMPIPTATLTPIALP